ncbi:MAG: RNA polymerase sigma factor [Chlorobia bacterium]|nr:RNA polymerase sigma factor [Fimbriimonadaceae bacterium]
MISIFTKRQTPKPESGALVERELEILFRIARQLTGNDSDAEDLVGQTLFQATRAWDRFDGQYPRSWLIKILRNEHLGSVRASQSRPTVSFEDSIEPVEACFWQEIDWKIVGQDLDRIMRMLPEEFRLAVALCDIEEITREEAAIALSVPVGTVNSRLHRGRKLLRAKIVEHLGDLSASQLGVLQS